MQKTSVLIWDEGHFAVPPNFAARALSVGYMHIPSPVTEGSVANIAGNADIILNGSKFEKESWAFLDWWTSAETQTLFGRMIEAKLGERARWNTSNMEAFKALPWKPYDLNIITQCWTYVNEIPVVLGGYMTGRNVVNAWNRVVLGGENPRNSLEEAVEDINRELLAKQEEYNLAPERK